jgi:hypothetical protein
MRKLILIIICLFTSLQTLAFKDVLTTTATQNLIRKLNGPLNKNEKFKTFKAFKVFLSHHLESFDLPDINLESSKDPEFEEYRSLTEFETYLDLIQPQKNKINCLSNIDRINIAGSTASFEMNEKNAAPEARLAHEVVRALCK